MDANAGLDDEDGTPGQVWCADGLLNLKIVNVNSDSCNHPAFTGYENEEQEMQMVPNRDGGCLESGSFVIKEESNKITYDNDGEMLDDNISMEVSDIVMNVNDIKKETGTLICQSISNNFYDDVEDIKVVRTVSSASSSTFEAGSLVWAKMSGYPSWPSIVVEDPKTKQYFKTKKSTKKKNGRGSRKDEEFLHVLFLNWMEEVAWIPCSSISVYKLQSNNKVRSRSDPRSKAGLIANSLLDMSCEERLERYADIQKTNRLSLVDKEVDHNKNYPKLFMYPIVKVQRIESALFESFL